MQPSQLSLEGHFVSHASGRETFFDFPLSLKILGSLMTEWTIWDLDGGQTRGWSDIENLTSLTRLNILDPCGVFDSTDFNMAELQALTRLHTLSMAEYCNLATRVPNYTNLQRLELSKGQDEVCDLTCCTRLTALHLAGISSNGPLRQVVLPRGDSVCLKELRLSSPGYLVQNYSMMNLELATKLTCISFLNTCPRNLKDGAWPRALPSLQTLALSGAGCDPPQELFLYSKLSELDMSHIHVLTLPPWFAGMTQLSKLTLHSCQFLNFPESLMALSQLQVLDMKGMHTHQLPERIIDFVSWPNLAILDLSVQDGQSHWLDSHVALLLLHNAFKTRGTRSPLIVDDIYTL